MTPYRGKYKISCKQKLTEEFYNKMTCIHFQNDNQGNRKIIYTFHNKIISNTFYKVQITYLKKHIITMKVQNYVQSICT